MRPDIGVGDIGLVELECLGVCFARYSFAKVRTLAAVGRLLVGFL